MKNSKISLVIFTALLAGVLQFGCDIEYMGEDCGCEDDFWGDGCDDDDEGDTPNKPGDSDDKDTENKDDPDDTGEEATDEDTVEEAQESTDDPDTGTGTIEETLTFWEEHHCDQVNPDDPCQDAVCEGIEGYEKALGECNEAGGECECAFIENCLTTLIECVNQNCEDEQNHDVGNMIDCVLAFSRCIDPCE